MKACYSAEAFVAKGFRRRGFFPHQAIALRKAYPDTFVQLQKRGVPTAQAARLKTWQINLYSPWVEDFPPELFTDSTVNWHNQQFGRPGLIACAGLFIDEDSLFVSLLQSDLCQQIGRHSGLKTLCAARLNNRFRYWYEILYNAILDFAVDLGLKRIYSPTARQIVGTTAKPIDPALFFQIYDSHQSRYQARLERVGNAEYWGVEVADNAHRIVRLERELSAIKLQPPPRVICLFHDIEENVDSAVDPQESHAALLQMLEIERVQGVKTTYNVLGQLFAHDAPLIAEHPGHSIAFHTYNHRLDAMDQLPLVRGVDLQVKGYRTARSVITDELSDYSLGFYNFEWLMSSEYSFGFDLPKIENGIVKIPVHLDDHPLSIGRLNYEQWISRLMTTTDARRFVSVGLHDCYSSFWIEKYAELLDQLQKVGELWTCDQIINQAYLTDAVAATADRHDGC
jgi:hypothetical protein